MTKIAGDPRRWLQRWLDGRGFGGNDRHAHEMHVLAGCLFHAATYDQMDGGRATGARDEEHAEEPAEL